MKPPFWLRIDRVEEGLPMLLRPWPGAADTEQAGGGAGA